VAFENVWLEYPVRDYAVTLKEFIVRGLFRKQAFRRRRVEALQDVSFRFVDGERVGVIGHNGAGKSTLLRTVGGIFPVSRGRRRVEGSISSLFEIAVGFEPDATGWQNIYYRAYLQGETPAGVKAKLPGIAEFSELGDFLHLPLRCYSAGMVMRLAFSIATSCEPDVLLIDEVFSTGDLAFQHKAEARMKDLIHRANVVIMVSHNLSFLEEFANRVLWLEHGKVRADGPPRQVIPDYIREVSQPAQAA
jgi:ABC-type polysaccharide/polyol phosphate transport system ATPase subunit